MISEGAPFATIEVDFYNIGCIHSSCGLFLEQKRGCLLDLSV